MPRIMLQSQFMLAQSKTSLCGRRNSSSWSYYHKSGSSNLYGSVEMRKPSMEKVSTKSQQFQAQQAPAVDNSNSSSIHNDDAASPDDWGFFVDITPQEELQTERKFLNGYDSGLRNKPLQSIADSGF